MFTDAAACAGATSCVCKLNGAQNYREWMLHAKMALMEKDCYDVANGTTIKPEHFDYDECMHNKEFKTDLRDWKKKNTTAIGLLTRLCSTSIAAEVIDFPTAHSIWKHLKEHYDHTSFNHAVGKWREFVTFRIRGGVSLSTVCQLYKRVVIEAREAGHVLDDTAAISQFLYIADEAGYTSFTCTQRASVVDKDRKHWPTLDSILCRFIHSSGPSSCHSQNHVSCHLPYHPSC